MPYRMKDAIDLSIPEKPISTFINFFPIESPISSIASGGTTGQKEKELHILLLIDNNIESAQFIATNLYDYKIIRAINEAEGLQHIHNSVPDIVLIDVSTPVVNGYECCKKIKGVRTSPVPVILLIEKCISDSCLEELSTDADDYLIKPFSKGELLLRIKKLLYKKSQLNSPIYSEAYSSIITKNDIPPIASVSSKADFLEKIYKTIEQHLDVSAFGVTDMAGSLFMSRTKLHRKLKSLTGKSAGAIIKEYRLQRATQFLKEGNNSADTAYKTGFSSPAYFSKCFRDCYQTTPNNFLRKNYKSIYM